VPGIVGFDPSEASNILRSVGLVLGSGHGVNTLDCSLLGIVLSQNPGNGSVVPAGSAVNYGFGVLPRGHSCE